MADSCTVASTSRTRRHVCTGVSDADSVSPTLRATAPSPRTLILITSASRFLTILPTGLFFFRRPFPSSSVAPPPSHVSRRVQGTSPIFFEDADARACPLPAVLRTPPLVDCGQFDWLQIVSVGRVAVLRRSMVGSCPGTLCVAMARTLHTCVPSARCAWLTCCMMPHAASQAWLSFPFSTQHRCTVIIYLANLDTRYL
jgi:hypothetical protein